MQVLLIANPNSTTQSPALFRWLVPKLRGVPGLRLKTMFTHYQGHARVLCEGLERKDYDLVVAVGGDGTVNEVINGLLGSPQSARPANMVPRLAVIPTGSANVFARALGFPAEPIAATDALVDTIVKQQTRAVELGTWGHSWFAVNAGFGIDADVIEAVERVRRRGFAATPLRYLRIALRAWRRLHRNPPRIDVFAEDRNGRTFREHRVPLFIASNTNPWTFLGPLPVVTNPRNSFDQGLGLFGVSTLQGVRGLAAMAHLIGFGHTPWIERWLSQFTLRFDDARYVHLRCHENRRFQADGEYMGKFDEITLRTVPAAIEVYAPVSAIPMTPLSAVRVALSFFSIRL